MPSLMVASVSAPSLTAEICGVSRMNICITAAQTIPMPPKIQNALRQPPSPIDESLPATVLEMMTPAYTALWKMLIAVERVVLS